MSGNFSETAQWVDQTPKISDGEEIDEILLNQAAEVLANRTQHLRARITNHAVDTGNVANAYVIALNPAMTAHVTGAPVRFTATRTNSGAATIAINALAAVPIQLADGSALNFGNIRNGGCYTAIYNGSAYVLLNPSERVGLLRMEYTVPAGYLHRNGAEISRATYADLYAWASANNLVVSEADWASSKSGLFGAGNGSTTFRLPDFRGEFERGLDSGRGVDTGRTLGSRQAPEIQAHNHDLGEFTDRTLIVGHYTGIYAPTTESGYPNNAGTGDTGGTETRPRNIALIPVIKA